MGGVFYQYILVNRGEKTAAGDIFAGFRRRFVHLMLFQLLLTFISALCFTPVFIVYGPKFLPLFAQLQALIPQIQAGSGDQTAAMDILKNMFGVFLSSLPWVLVCSLPMIYISVSLIFALPLIIDKDMDVLPAMGMSWRMAGKHWFLIFGLVILMELVKLSGLLGCCIGILFTMPIAFGALMCAYETIFCQPKKN
jgi:uncharacterized membrane protein